MDKAKLEALKNATERLQKALGEAQNALATVDSILNPKGVQKAEKKPERPQKVAKTLHVANSLPQSELGEVPELTEDWPEAINHRLIAVSQEEKEFKALQEAKIIEEFIQLKDTEILDVGCGQGFLVKELERIAKRVVGYDIEEHDSWDIDGGHRDRAGFAINNDDKFTTETLSLENERFDTIILFDVLDHISRATPANLLEWCKNLLKKNGRIFVRFHPWTARHGAHYAPNKAFAHLIFTPSELAHYNMVPNDNGALSNQKIVRPALTYEKWIADAGLEIKEKKVRSTEVEPFFEKHLTRMSKVTWAGDCDPETIVRICKIDYIDYVLSK